MHSSVLLLQQKLSKTAAVTGLEGSGSPLAWARTRRRAAICTPSVVARFYRTESFAVAEYLSKSFHTLTAAYRLFTCLTCLLAIKPCQGSRLWQFLPEAQHRNTAEVRFRATRWQAGSDVSSIWDEKRGELLG